MKATGRLKADQLSIAKFTIDRVRDLPKIEVLAALTNSRTGQTHGWVDGTGLQWSEKTNTAFRAFIGSLEEDLERLHFDGTLPSTDGATDGRTGIVLPEGGLSEHLGVPSV